MKFVTEEDLRDLYKKQPFTDYDLQEGERLTPGARQFLLDRGIDMYDRNDPFASAASSADEAGTGSANRPGGKRQRMFCCKMNALKSLFLLTAKEMLSVDVCMSQTLTGLYRQLAALGKKADEGGTAEDLACSACTGINGENFSQDLGCCFEITEFHMQMPKGREILLLDRLRSEMQLFELDAVPLLDSGKQQDISCKLNQIINTLSQMICAAVGGNECQRKI